MKPILSLRGISRIYDGRTVLSDISFDIGDGEAFAMIGRSGSGKSTLFRCIAGLEHVDTGGVYLPGQQFEAGASSYIADYLRRNVVSVLQGGFLFRGMTGLENLTFALRKREQIPREEANARAFPLAERLGVTGVLNLYPEQMSGGQAQRIALGRALILRPRILLLDEITSALDPTTTVEVVATLRALRYSEELTSTTILFSTHLLRFAYEFADRIGFLQSGKLIEIHPAAEFARVCEHPATRDFIDAYSLPF